MPTPLGAGGVGALGGFISGVGTIGKKINKMTIIELFPWLLAIGVTMLSGEILQSKAGMDGMWVYVMAVTFGIGSWFLYTIALKKLASHFAKKPPE